MSEFIKIKLLNVLRIMEETDSDHPLNSSGIGRKLEDKGIKAERKSIARDIKCIQEVGYPVFQCENRRLGWYMDKSKEKRK
jgi:repressor of nif and glnA expression